MLASPDNLRVLRVCSVFEPPPHLHLNPVARFDPIGGMQNHTAELTRGLDRLGARQTVVTTRPPGSPRLQRVGDNATVVRLGWPIRRFRQLYSLPASAHVLRAAARSDLVHAHLGEDLAVIPLAFGAAAVHGLPVVLTIHCSLRHTFTGAGPRALLLKTLGAELERMGVTRADAVIVLTRRLERLVAADRGREGVHVIPPGVHPDVFRGPFEDPVPGVPRPRLLFVGRLAPQKGVLTLVRAVPLIRPDARIVLVGDGPHRQAVEEEVRRLGIEDRVALCGFIHHDRIPAYYRHADALVLPSTYEELGSVLLEAMHVGLPVVASRTGGIPDAVRDGENGLLFPSGDHRALAGAVNRLLDDPDLRARISDGARAAAGRYDWRSLAGEILEVYRGALAGRRVPHSIA